jgi:DNA-binding SARP family transcriptional activator
MEFRILGPLEAEVGGQLLPLRGRRQRSLLALLLLSANEVVPDDRLLEDIWGDEPPASGRAALRGWTSGPRGVEFEGPARLGGGALGVIRSRR